MSDQTIIPSPLGIPGLVFPPRPPILHALPITQVIPSQNAPLINLSTLLTAWAKRAHDHFHDLLETLESCKDSETYRRQLIDWLITTHGSLTKLIVLVQYVMNNQAIFARLQSINRILYSRDFVYQTSVDMLKILARHLDTSMTPAYDVHTARHTMATGSYRLLPKMIERVIGVKPTLSKQRIESIKQRLDDALHAHLLRSVLPDQYTNIRVRAGMAWLTVKNEFIVGVSLRMMPQQTPPVSEDQRIKWRLFHAAILVGIDPTQSNHHSALINDSQLAHLIAHCNAIMHQHAEPLLILYQTMHAFVVNLSLSLLHSQAQALQSAYHHALTVHYKTSHSLSIQYWPEAESIPISVNQTINQSFKQIVNQAHSSKSTERPIIMQLVVDETGTLIIQHQPPLPDMELALQTCDNPSDNPFTVNTSRLSISHLFTLVIASHANFRLSRLQSFIIRAAQEQRADAFMSINLVDDSQGSPIKQDRLIIQLSTNRSIAVRVDRTSGNFQFAFSDFLVDRAGHFNADQLHRSLYKLAEHIRDQKFHLIIPSLTDMRVACIISDVMEQCSVENIRATRGLPILWTQKWPAPNQANRLIYIRCRSNPVFYLVCSVELDNNDQSRETSSSPTSSIPIKLFMLHTDDIDQSTVPAPVIPQPHAVSPKPLPKRTHVSLIYPASLIPIVSSDLPSHQLYFTTDGASLTNITLLKRALLHCETRIPLSLLAAQLQRQPNVTIVQLDWPRKIIFTVPFPPAPAPAKGSAHVTFRLTPYSPLNNKSTIDRMALARISSRTFGTEEREERDGRGIDSQPVIRCGWTAVVEYTAFLNIWTDPTVIRVRAGQPPLTTGMVIAPEVPSPDSYRLPLLQYDSIANDSIHVFINQVSRLWISQHFAKETLTSFRYSQEDWQEREKRADTNGYDPVPGFFQLMSCSVDGWVVRYDLSRVPFVGTSVSDICTLTIRQRREGELEPFSHLTNMLHKQGTVSSVTASPYPFPHAAFLEIEFSLRYDIKQLLRHVYWSCVAMKIIHAFMRNITNFDTAAGFHRLALAQVVSFGQPQQGPNGLVVNTSQGLCMRAGPHTVVCVPQSSTRLRFFFRKQGKATKLDLRFVNGYVFVQDFWPQNGQSSNQAGANGADATRPASRVALGQLNSLLQTWYQTCGQIELWKRASRWQGFTNPPLKIQFERLPLGNHPTSKPLVTMKVSVGTEPDCLSEPHATALMRYFHMFAGTPPYSSDSVVAVLTLCQAPRPVLLEFIPLFEYECEISSPNSSDTFRQGCRENKVVFRWCSWPAMPFSVDYDVKASILTFTAEFTDRRRGEAMYIPLAYSMRSHRIAVWDHEEIEMNQKMDAKGNPIPSNLPPCYHSSRKYRELRIGGPKQWKSLWSVVSFLMKHSIGDLVGMLGQVTPNIDKFEFGEPVYHVATTTPPVIRSAAPSVQAPPVKMNAIKSNTDIAARQDVVEID